MKRIHVTLALCALSTAVGCWNYEEEIWLNPNGSGRARITIKFLEEAYPKADQELSAEQKSFLLRQEAERRFTRDPGVRVVKVEEVRDAGMIAWRVSLSFTALPNLERALNKGLEDFNNGGELRLVKSGHSMRFHRHVAAMAKGHKPTDPAMERFNLLLYQTQTL